MTKKNLNTILINIISAALMLASQNNDVDSSKIVNYNCMKKMREVVYIHASRNCIVAGQQIYFKAYILGAGNTLGKSKILYFTLIDSNNKLIKFIRTNVDNGISYSSFIIPDTLPTGFYKLTGYTNFMRNYPAPSLTYATILIIGVKNQAYTSTLPKYFFNKKESDQISTLPDSSNHPDNLIFKAYLNKQEYKPKEKVILSLSITDNNLIALKGFASVSVSEAQPDNYSNLNADITSFSSTMCAQPETINKFFLEEPNQLISAAHEYYKWMDKAKENDAVNILYKAEYSGYTCEGTLINKNCKNIYHPAEILLSTDDGLSSIRYAAVDNKGKFIFGLNKKFDNKKLFFSCLENDIQKDFDFAIDNKVYFDSSAKVQKLEPDENLTKYFDKCKKIALINNLYKAVT